MADIIIDISELRKKNAEKARELSNFLEAKLGVNIAIKEDMITLKEEVSSQARLRVLIRKFLHKSGLKEGFRPLCAKGKIIIRRRRKREE